VEYRLVRHYVPVLLFIITQLFLSKLGLEKGSKNGKIVPVLKQSNILLRGHFWGVKIQPRY
jgi:hypothetical protein